MFVGGVSASVYTGGNPILVNGTFEALRAIIKKNNPTDQVPKRVKSYDNTQNLFQ